MVGRAVRVDETHESVFRERQSADSERVFELERKI